VPDAEVVGLGLHPWVDHLGTWNFLGGLSLEYHVRSSVLKPKGPGYGSPVHLWACRTIWLCVFDTSGDRFEGSKRMGDQILISGSSSYRQRGLIRGYEVNLSNSGLGPFMFDDAQVDAVICQEWNARDSCYRRTSISRTTFSGKKCLSGKVSMLFDLTFPCYLTTFSGKKCLSGKVICAFFGPLIEVLLYYSSGWCGQVPRSLR
jgi:hypothetical protein